MAKILVVDDEHHVRECLALELSGEGYDVYTEPSCSDLLAKIRELQPDLVVLDIRIVDCDGLEMLRLIRETDRNIPVIICSAYDSYRYDNRVMAADYYVIKSFDLGNLKTKIARALQAGTPSNLLSAISPLPGEISQ